MNEVSGGDVAQEKVSDTKRMLLQFSTILGPAMF